MRLISMILLAGLVTGSLWLTSSRAAAAAPERPVPLIYDTDMGNDIDDALALGVIHALQDRGECRLLAVTLSKDEEYAAPYVDLVNRFYGRGDVPIGVVRNGKTPEPSRYTGPVVRARDNGRKRYPHKLTSGKDAPEAVGLLREVLAAQPDGSVVMVVVGFSTNLARLLESEPDRHSPLNGVDLVAKKCRLLSIMACIFEGDFSRIYRYNVIMDIPSARKVFADWPTPMVISGAEVGSAIEYTAVSIERDFAYVPHHPLAEAYRLYKDMPYNRETWDLTSVLYAVRPDRGYFDLSEPGTVTIDEEGIDTFTPSEQGRHRYLKVSPEQVIRVREALEMLASQPPVRLGTK